MVNRNNKKCLENYMSISDEVKHMNNSLMRLKLLFSLYESDKTMKQINNATGLSYSAISTNIRILELEEYILRDGNYYFLSNVMRIYLKNLLEFNQTLYVLSEFYNLFENHKVRNIPICVMSELYMLEDSELIESSGTDIYKINDVIVGTLKKSKEMKAILPISFKQLTKAIRKLIKKGKKAELKISEDIFNDITKDIDLDILKDIKIKKFEKEVNFLLIIADDTMMLSLYKKDGTFDQNRILISKSKEALKWANNLYDVI